MNQADKTPIIDEIIRKAKTIREIPPAFEEQLRNMLGSSGISFERVDKINKGIFDDFMDPLQMVFYNALRGYDFNNENRINSVRVDNQRMPEVRARVSAEVKADIQRLARKRGISTSELIRNLLDRELANDANISNEENRSYQMGPNRQAGIEQPRRRRYNPENTSENITPIDNEESVIEPISESPVNTTEQPRRRRYNPENTSENIAPIDNEESVIEPISESPVNTTEQPRRRRYNPENADRNESSSDNNEEESIIDEPAPSPSVEAPVDDHPPIEAAGNERRTRMERFHRDDPVEERTTTPDPSGPNLRSLEERQELAKRALIDAGINEKDPILKEVIPMLDEDTVNEILNEPNDARKIEMISDTLENAVNNENVSRIDMENSIEESLDYINPEIDSTILDEVQKMTDEEIKELYKNVDARDRSEFVADYIMNKSLEEAQAKMSETTKEESRIEPAPLEPPIDPIRPLEAPVDPIRPLEAPFQNNPTNASPTPDGNPQVTPNNAIDIDDDLTFDQYLYNLYMEPIKDKIDTLNQIVNDNATRMNQPFSDRITYLAEDRVDRAKGILNEINLDILDRIEEYKKTPEYASAKAQWISINSEIDANEAEMKNAGIDPERQKQLEDRLAKLRNKKGTLAPSQRKIVDIEAKAVVAQHKRSIRKLSKRTMKSNNRLDELNKFLKTESEYLDRIEALKNGIDESTNRASTTQKKNIKDHSIIQRKIAKQEIKVMKRKLAVLRRKEGKLLGYDWIYTLRERVSYFLEDDSISNSYSPNRSNYSPLPEEQVVSDGAIDAEFEPVETIDPNVNEEVDNPFAAPEMNPIDYPAPQLDTDHSRRVHNHFDAPFEEPKEENIIEEFKKVDVEPDEPNLDADDYAETHPNVGITPIDKNYSAGTFDEAGIDELNKSIMLRDRLNALKGAPKIIVKGITELGEYLTIAYHNRSLSTNEDTKKRLIRQMKKAGKIVISGASRINENIVNDYNNKLFEVAASRTLG